MRSLWSGIHHGIKYIGPANSRTLRPGLPRTVLYEFTRPHGCDRLTLNEARQVTLLTALT